MKTYSKLRPDTRCDVILERSLPRDERTVLLLGSLTDGLYRVHLTRKAAPVLIELIIYNKTAGENIDFKIGPFLFSSDFAVPNKPMKTHWILTIFAFSRLAISLITQFLSHVCGESVFFPSNTTFARNSILPWIPNGF